MAVHRISDRAEAALKRIAELEKKKPSDILSQLIVEYEAGLTFEKNRMN